VIDDLKIEQFRGFKSYLLHDLNRVNLLVGDNNAGKTSVLEAVEILSAGGAPGPLFRCALRRGEYDVEDDRRRRKTVDFRHFFHKRILKPEYKFRISDPQGENKSAEVALKKVAEQTSLFESSNGEVGYTTFSDSFALQLKGHAVPEETTFPVRKLQEDFGRRLPPGQLPNDVGEPTQFVATQQAASGSLAQLWDEMVLTQREEYVVNALNIIDPAIERVAFLGESRRQEPNYAGIVVRREGSDKRFPIGSMGDGLKRLLHLSVHLASARNGYLLIDEIDTGLHYSVMQKMWRLVISAAVDLNIQVFATTHSLDCLQSLARLHEEHGELAESVSVHRLKSKMNESIRHSSGELKEAIDHEMEVR